MTEVKTELAVKGLLENTLLYFFFFFWELQPAISQSASGKLK